MTPNDRASPRRRKSEPEGALDAGLYLVATPIGNLGDITLRALDVLKRADVIACEDTRVSRKLLQAYEIKTPTIAYHDHNAGEMRPKLLARIAEGQAVALISDAGTPLVSDPGYKLVRGCAEAGLPVTALPGASAVLAALSLSALPTDRFCFTGFLPPREAARKTVLRELASVPATLVFFESPGRLAATLASMVEMLGDREAAVARELTKHFEETRRGKLSTLAAHYAEAGQPKGEIVLVVGPPVQGASEPETGLDERLREALTSLSLKEAVAQVSAKTGLPRREVYARALTLTREN